MVQCEPSNTTLYVKAALDHIMHDILVCVYLILGTAGHFVLLIAFYKQSKVEATYIYQVVLTVSKTMEVITYGGFLFGTHHLSSGLNHGVDWFRKSYLLMFVSLQVMPVLSQHFLTSSILLAAAMSADRVFALTAPFRYKEINHRRHQVVATAVCFLLPIVSSIGNARMFELPVKDGDKYMAVFPDRNTVLSQLLSRIGTVFRLTALIALITLNAVMVVAYKKRAKNVAAITNRPEKQEAKKQANRSLFILNMTQSILMCVNQIPQVTLHVLMYSNGGLLNCVYVLPPISCFMVYISDTTDLAVIMFVNKQTRRMVENLFGFKCQCGRVAPSTVNKHHQPGKMVKKR